MPGRTSAQCQSQHAIEKATASAATTELGLVAIVWAGRFRQSSAAPQNILQNTKRVPHGMPYTNAYTYLYLYLKINASWQMTAQSGQANRPNDLFAKRRWAEDDQQTKTQNRWRYNCKLRSSRVWTTTRHGRWRCVRIWRLRISGALWTMGRIIQKRYTESGRRLSDYCILHMFAVAAERQTRKIHHPVPDRDEVVPVHGQHTHIPGPLELSAHPAFPPLKKLLSLQTKQHIHI